MRGRAPPSVAEVSKVAGQKTSSGRHAKFLLVVLLIYVRSPLAQDFKCPHMTLEDEGRGFFRNKWEEDSLFANSKLAAEAILSILRDSDLRRARCHVC